MSNIPLVSICIPVFGVEKFISRCFLSLVDQDYKNIELVFVNDCTKDRSMIILNDLIKEYNYQKYTKIINHSVNQGLAAARASGIKASTGDYLFFIDSDDTIAPNAISNLVKYAIEKGADIVEGNFIYIDDKGKKKYVPKTSCSKKEYLLKLLSLDAPVSVCAKLYSRDIFYNHGTLFKNGIDDGEDFATTPRIIDVASSIYFSNVYVYNYYYVSNTNSYTNSKGVKTINDMVNAFNLLTQYFSSKNDAVYQKAIDLGKAKFIRTNYYCIDSGLRYRLGHYFPEIKHRVNGESNIQYIERRLMAIDSVFVYFSLTLIKKVSNKLFVFYNR